MLESTVYGASPSKAKLGARLKIGDANECTLKINSKSSMTDMLNKRQTNVHNEGRASSEESDDKSEPVPTYYFPVVVQRKARLNLW